MTKEPHHAAGRPRRMGYIVFRSARGSVERTGEGVHKRVGLRRFGADAGKARHALAFMLYALGEHGKRPCPQPALTIERLVENQRLLRLAVRGDAEHAVHAAFKMAIDAGNEQGDTPQKIYKNTHEMRNAASQVNSASY
jgi:hypothetical protein